MTKTVLLKSLGALGGSLALFSLGAGGYILLSGDPINKVEEPSFPLITFHKAKGTWERTREFTEARFYLRCSGNGHWGAEECIRFMRVNNQGDKEDRIFLFKGEPTQGEQGWPIYKFKYTGELEKGIEEYQGQCKKNGRDEDVDYLCSTNNLPKGWTKEFVKNIE